MASKTEVVPVRQYQRYDGIAIARHSDDVKNRRAQIAATERSANMGPLNPGGHNDPGRVAMQSAVAIQVAQLNQELSWIESLEGDTRVMHYCSGEIAYSAQPPVMELRNPDGSPLLKGGQASMFAPGMNSAVNG